MLGDRLRAARRRRGWSLHEVEALSDQEFKASVLGAYERGERALSVQRLHRLAVMYRVPVNQLVPTEDQLVDQPEVIDLSDLEGLSGEQSVIVDRFLSAIHLMRRSGPSGLTVRRADVAVLTAIVDSSRGMTEAVMGEDSEPV